MNQTTLFGILIALLLLLGGLLFLAAQFILHKIKSEHTQAGMRKKKLWIWRGFVLVLLIYSIFLLVLNKRALFEFFEGPLEIFIVMFLVIYFVALIEIVVIDLLLPDVVKMWKRITIEVVVFILLCSITVFSFNLSLFFLSRFV
jgi:hypothetical protein